MGHTYNFEPSLCDCGAVIPHTVVMNSSGFGARIWICPDCVMRNRFGRRHLLPLPIKEREPRPVEGSLAWQKELEELRVQFGYYVKKEDNHAESSTE